MEIHRNMNHSLAVRLGPLCALLLLSATHAGDWPRFRGPNGSGIQTDQHLPAEIGKNRNVAWTQKTPKGNSSPIVVGDRIWITGHEGDDRGLRVAGPARTSGPRQTS